MIALINEDIMCIGPWDNDQVETDFNDTEIKYSDQANTYILSKWSEYCKNRKQAYDSRQLRLISWMRDNGKLKLDTQITRYSNYIATRDPEFIKRFPNEVRADPIGLTIIPITIDGFVVASKRSARMEQNPNKLYFFGGHAEPNIGNSGTVNLKNESLREVEEELGANRFIFINFLGLSYDPVYCHPELTSTTVIDITKQSITETWRNAIDRYESDLLLFIPLNNFVDTIPTSDTTWSFEIGRKLFTQKVLAKIGNVINNHKV